MGVGKFPTGDFSSDWECCQRFSALSPLSIRLRAGFFGAGSNFSYSQDGPFFPATACHVSLQTRARDPSPALIAKCASANMSTKHRSWSSSNAATAVLGFEHSILWATFLTDTHSYHMLL